MKFDPNAYIASKERELEAAASRGAPPSARGKKTKVRGPWEDYAKARAAAGPGPWDDYAPSKTTEEDGPWNDYAKAREAGTPRAAPPPGYGAKPSLAKEVATGVGEPILSTITGAIAAPVAGWAGLGAELTHALGLTHAAPADVVRSVERAMTYAPRTSAGRTVNHMLAWPLTHADRALGDVGGDVGAWIGPRSEAAGQTIGRNLVPVALTLSGLRGAIKAGALPVREMPAATPEQALNTTFQDLGYKLPPAEARPNVRNHMLTGYGGKIRTQQDMSVANQAVTNRLARDTLAESGHGLLSENLRRDLTNPDKQLTPDMLARVRKEAGKAYEAVARTKEPVYTNPTYEAAIDGLSSQWQAAERDFPELRAGTKNIRRLQETLRKPHVSPTGAIEMIKRLRREGTAYRKNWQNPQLVAYGNAELKGADALEQLVDDNLRHNALSKNAPHAPDLVQRYQQARRLIAQTHNVEDALNDVTGNVSARHFGNLLNRGAPLTGGLRSIGEFAQAHEKLVQQPERIGVRPAISPLDAAAGSIEAASALAAGRPGVAAGFLSAIAGRPLARALALSDRYQHGPGAARIFDYAAHRRPVALNALKALYAGQATAQVPGQNAMRRR